MVSLTEEIICPECGKDNPIHDPITGDIICRECGGVILEKEIKISGGVRKPNHIGTPRKNMLLCDHRQRGSFIDKKNRDVFGKKFSSVGWRNRRKWNDSSTGKERRIDYVLHVLKLYSNKLELQSPSPIEDEAAFILRKFLKKNLIMGRSFESLVVAGIYLAHKVKKTPVILEDILKKSGIKRKVFFRAYKILVKFFEMKVENKSPSSFIPEIAIKLGISEETQRLAFNSLKEVEGRPNFVGKSPPGIAASALYLTCQKTKNEKKTQKEVSVVAGITEATLRNRNKELKYFF